MIVFSYYVQLMTQCMFGKAYVMINEIVDVLLCVTIETKIDIFIKM